MDPDFRTIGLVGKRPLGLIDGANDDEEDETQDRCGAEGEDRLGSAAGAGDGAGFGAAL